MAFKTVLAALAVAIFAGLAAAEPAKPNTGIQSYDVIDGKNHLLRARREPYTVRVSSLGGSHGAKSQIEASLVRPKRFFGLHRRPKVIVLHSQPSYVQPPPQVVYIRKHHRKHHHHHHHHRPGLTVHLG
ncbi:uncharacterized protein LOC113208471 isoform X1 [Frankliniella occidentalis]|uniref:Uncharacterized protein LOC113208471 isoform X1 n=1 Tax=Frankliniella occidentalis TaxID=133901 RepID=A0A6J1SS09_FRAOC|nr:uncharacterized protein LOC113208471 isoform X1 [Frankliniella occidentalis]